MLNKQTASSDKELPWNVTVSREFLFQKQSQQPLPVTLRMAKYGRAVFPPDLCPSGVNWVIKKPSSKTAFLWWSWRGSNPRPIDCEPIALPTELQPHYAAWFIELRNNCQSFSLVQPYLSIAAIFIWNRSHKSIHMQLTFFNNQTIITVRRYGRHKGTGISAGTNYHN